METITIKPHHFMDIIKLYGAGIESFVPDEKLGHDFYRIGNLVLAYHAQPLLLTIEGDDICKPCRQYRGLCQDALTNIPGFTGKDEYNHALDSRVLSLYGLNILYGKSKDPKIITIKKMCDGLDITLAEFFDSPELRALEPEIK